MSELQAEAAESEVLPTEQEAQTEPSQRGSELATDNPVEGEKETQSDRELAQQKAQQAINKQHRKFREEQRRANDAERRLKDLEDSLNKPPEDVTIPAIPDQWDDDYEVKIKQREQAITQKAKFDAFQIQKRESEALAQREAERRQYQEAQQLQDKFSESAQKLGVDQKSLDQAQNAVIDYGVTPDIANALLNDSDGPLMVQYLAANPLELSEIVNANPVSAGLLLANVKSKASALKPKPSSAPDPATTVSGGSAPKKERGPAGATFE